MSKGNRRNIIVISIVVAILIVSSVAVLIEYNQSATMGRINLDLVPLTNQTGILQGSSSQFKVLVNSIGRVGDITLSSDVGSSGINCTFEPAIGMSNFTSTLTVNVPASTPTGNYSVTIIASGNGVHQNATFIVSVLLAKGDNVTVSGNVMLNPLGASYEVSLTQIQFIDTQTNSTVTINFPYIFPIPESRPYTVSLQNQHTYKVIISYWWGTAGMNIPSSFEVSNFFVHAPAGNNTMSGQDFKNY